MSMITAANHYYYVKEPIMTDNEYDILKEYIEDTYPDTEFEIGASVPETATNKKTLPYQMPSMNKKKMKNQLIYGLINIHHLLIQAQHEKTISYIVSAKLDGVSAMFYNENGEQKLYTRGDGTTGQDISHMVPYLPQLTKNENKENYSERRTYFLVEQFSKKYAKSFKKCSQSYIRNCKCNY